MLAWSLAAFDDFTLDDLVVVVREEDATRLRAEPALRAPSGQSRHVTSGGAERQDSVRAGLAALTRECEIVIVHDAARPLVTPALIRRCLAALTGAGRAGDPAGVVPAVPLTDTVKRVEEARIVETVDRAGLVCAQTPQVFRRDALEAAHRMAGAFSDLATDDAALVERAGHLVCWIEGDPANIKVTWPPDIALAEALLGARRTGTERR